MVPAVLIDYGGSQYHTTTVVAGFPKKAAEQYYALGHSRKPPAIEEFGKFWISKLRWLVRILIGRKRLPSKCSRSSHQGRDIQLHRGDQASVEVPTPIEIETSIRCVIT